MDLTGLLFWIIAIILVGSALLVVGLRNIVHSALALVVLFAMAAGIYLLLNAEFIAIVQILIYAGAVTILVLFALMLTRTPNLGGSSNPNNKQWWLAAIISTLPTTFNRSRESLSSAVPARSRWLQHIVIYITIRLARTMINLASEMHRYSRQGTYIKHNT